MATTDARSGLAGSLQPRVLVPALTTGVVIGIVEVVLATSFAALIFSGRMASHLPAGIGLGLFAGAVLLLVVAVTSSIRGAIGSVQDTSSAILAIMGASIAARLPPDAAFITTVAAIAMTAVITGGFFLLLGSLRLGNLVRYIPYPVVGGFLAGTGWLLFKGGIELISGRSLTLATVSEFTRPDVLLRWVPGLGFAFALLVVLRRYAHFLILPVTVLGGVAAFYAVLLLAGGSPAEAQAEGWLLGPFPGRGLWRPWLLTALGEADWSVALGQAANMGAVLLLSVLALLLNATGIEVVAGRDVDLNRELRAAGGANVISGLGGGLVGYQTLSVTALAVRSGAATRLVGIVAAGVCTAALLFGASTLSLMPRVVLGGLVVFLGVGFLFEWVIEAWRKLPRTDYAVVLLILAVVAALGFLQGVAVGLVVVLITFVINYSKTDVVRSTLSCATYQSNLDRPPAHRDALRSAGEQVHILLLQGFLFFGTANRLLEGIRGRVVHPALPKLRFLVLDFRRVSGIDSSATLSFAKVLGLAQSHAFQLIFSGLSEGLRSQLVQAGFPLDDVRLFPDLDRAVQWCEDELLARAPMPLDEADAWTGLRAPDGEPLHPARLMPYLDRIEVGSGETVMRQADPSEDVYFLQSGRLAAELARPDGTPVRLRSMGPGSVVGEVAFYVGTPRSASVTAEAPSVLLRLSRRSLERMEAEQPDLAAALHRMLARALAGRLGDTVRGLEALLD
ncbi:MAG TPA: SulP family inorganic anion transporter [Actinomycetota bacterium]|nr:SulP family inorganic anion transporter [Actinomycetota bacterium]